MMTYILNPILKPKLSKRKICQWLVDFVVLWWPLEGSDRSVQVRLIYLDKNLEKIISEFIFTNARYDEKYLHN